MKRVSTPAPGSDCRMALTQKSMPKITHSTTNDRKAFYRVMHCSAGTAVHMRALFPKESPTLGFSFSLVVSGGAEREEDGCGRGCGWRWEGGQAWTGL